VEPVATKCSFNYQAQSNRVSTSQSLKSHFITIQNVPVYPSSNNSSQKTVFFHQSCVFHQKPKSLLPSTVVRAKPKKSRVASLGLETLFTNGQPFQFNSRVSRAEKIIRGCTTQVSIGVSVKRIVFRGYLSKSFLVNQLRRVGDLVLRVVVCA